MVTANSKKFSSVSCKIFPSLGLYRVSGQQTCPLYIIISDFCGMKSDVSM